MFNKKSQTLVVKEILFFAIGVAVIAGIIALFNQILSSELKTYTIDKKIDYLLNQIDYITYNLYFMSARSSTISNISYTLSMPETLSGDTYTIWVKNGYAFCIKLGTGTQKCLNSSLPKETILSGEHFSSNELIVFVERNQTNVKITLT